MKNVFLFVFILTTSFAKAQKHDNVWPLSYYWSPTGPYYYLDFSIVQPDTVIYQRTMSFFVTNAAFSDSLGNIEFYTNGQWVANRNNDTLLGSTNFNYSYGTTLYNKGLGYSQSAIFLPVSDSLIYLVHNSLDTFTNKDGNLDGQPFNLKYTLINTKLDNGNGGVVQGNIGIAIINDTLLLGRITATKHGNGRDWWVLVHKYYSDIYYSLLFTPQGVLGPFAQQMGAVLKPKGILGVDYDLAGMAVFSPDGSKYVNIDYDTLQLFDFDRCNGVLSNFYPINQMQCDSFRLMACSFSSNSKYVYANTLYKAFQIDTDTTDINGSTSLIGNYDGFLAPSQTIFNLSQLGPNGKIYLSTYNGTRVLHVIENPDSAGLACNFNQHSFALPQNYGGNSSLPNFPNYRLGRLVGSPCDTLTAIAETNVVDFKLKLTPNPNNGNFIINYQLPQNKSGTLQILDVLGKQVYSQPLPQWSTMQRISLPALPSGIYVVKVTCGQLNSTIKFVKE